MADIGRLDDKKLIGVRVKSGDIFFKIEGQDEELSRDQTYTFSVGDYPYEWDEDAIALFLTENLG